MSFLQLLLPTFNIPTQVCPTILHILGLLLVELLQPLTGRWASLDAISFMASSRLTFCTTTSAPSPFITPTRQARPSSPSWVATTAAILKAASGASLAHCGGVQGGAIGSSRALMRKVKEKGSFSSGTGMDWGFHQYRESSLESRKWRRALSWLLTAM